MLEQNLQFYLLDTISCSVKKNNTGDKEEGDINLAWKNIDMFAVFSMLYFVLLILFQNINPM